jgi:hypothetical protein
VNPGFIVAAIAYTVFSLGLAAIELRRIRSGGPDAITVFIAIFMLQCCLPGVSMYAALSASDVSDLTGNPVFDGIFSHTDFTISMLVLAMTIWFIAFFYIGAACGRHALTKLFPSHAQTFRIEGISARLMIVIFGGLALTLLSFYLLGDDIADRFSNLVRLRAYDDSVERTDLASYAYVLTQSWAWVSIPALFVLSERPRRGFAWYAVLVCAILFAILSASRRAIFVPVMLSYFTFLLYDGKWRVRLLVGLAVPIIILVLYGKETFATFAFGGAAEAIAGRYESTAGAVLRASSEQGITIVESLGTLTFLDDQLRLGVDHVLSIAQRFPHRLFGLDIDYPERMVRISTEAFSGPEAQDIPPGLMGQMWLDFRLFGPIVWGMLLGIQVGVAQWWFERIRRTKQASALFALIIFLIALPVNTGTYDFTFSVDVIAAVLALWLSFRVQRAVRAS